MFDVSFTYVTFNILGGGPESTGELPWTFIVLCPTIILSWAVLLVVYYWAKNFFGGTGRYYRLPGEHPKPTEEEPEPQGPPKGPANSVVAATTAALRKRSLLPKPKPARPQKAEREP
ncbi:hypothetical protein BJX64DRAFT_290386 [Aspergillus heterothallicus]